MFFYYTLSNCDICLTSLCRHVCLGLFNSFASVFCGSQNIEFVFSAKQQWKEFLRASWCLFHEESGYDRGLQHKGQIVYLKRQNRHGGFSDSLLIQYIFVSGMKCYLFTRKTGSPADINTKGRQHFSPVLFFTSAPPPTCVSVPLPTVIMPLGQLLQNLESQSFSFSPPEFEYLSCVSKGFLKNKTQTRDH